MNPDTRRRTATPALKALLLLVIRTPCNARSVLHVPLGNVPIDSGAALVSWARRGHAQAHRAERRLERGQSVVQPSILCLGDVERQGTQST